MPYSRLRAFLARRGGAASFADFMEAALYDPQHGYYSRRIPTVGRGGDFSTTATLSPHLGKALAHWLGNEHRPLIEIGPGDGSLAETLLQALGWWRRRGASLWMVERSPVLKAQQQKRLQKYPQVRWADSVEQALSACQGCAVLYSNELVDAFPVILAEWGDDCWQEVWLEISPQGGLIETLRPFPNGLSGRTLQGEWKPRPGQRVEVAWSYRQWLAAWLPMAVDVRLLTVDYGDSLAGAQGRRLGGTLRGYLRHERKEGLAIYENMGSQDLTTDVSFADLELWGQELGLRTVSHESQATFLRRHLPRQTQSRELIYLLDEQGAGGAFRVLEQVFRARSDL